MKLLSLEPESSASANSATSANLSGRLPFRPQYFTTRRAVCQAPFVIFFENARIFSGANFSTAQKAGMQGRGSAFPLEQVRDSMTRTIGQGSR